MCNECRNKCDYCANKMESFSGEIRWRQEEKFATLFS